MHASLAERIHILGEIADDDGLRPSDRIKAIELLARYGLRGQQDENGQDGSWMSIEWMSAARAELIRRVREIGSEEFAKELAELAEDDGAR